MTVARRQSAIGLSRGWRSLRTISGSTTADSELRTATTSGSPNRPIVYWASGTAPSTRATTTLLRFLLSIASSEARPEGTQNRSCSRQGSASRGSQRLLSRIASATAAPASRTPSSATNAQMILPTSWVNAAVTNDDFVALSHKRFGAR